MFTKDMNTTASHKELTAHIRNRIKVAGIKVAGVRMLSYCGEQVISVYPKGGVDARLSESDQDAIVEIAAANGLTFSQGLPLYAAVDGCHVHGTGFRFYMGYAR